MIIPSNPRQAVVYRLKRGTKNANLPYPSSLDEIPSLSQIDGPFQLGEYLSLKVNADVHDVKGLVELPPEGRSTDKDVWVYEHLRRIPIDITPLVSSLLEHCDRSTCPQMRADEWQYLCTAHGEKATEECCAIDYILHTLDSTTTLLTSTKQFPSRMSIPPASTAHFPSLSRRLSRIFSHAYYHHRELFLLFESEYSLYSRFVALCDKFSLVGKDLLVIPRSVLNQDVQGSSDEQDEDEEMKDREEAHELNDEAVEENIKERTEDTGETQKDEREEESQSFERQGKDGTRTKNVDTDFNVDKDGGSGSEKVKMAFDSTGKNEHDTPQSTLPINTASTTATPSIPKLLSRSTNPEEQTAKKSIGILKKGTLGRGKASRGTMLWNSDEPLKSDLPEEIKNTRSVSPVKEIGAGAGGAPGGGYSMGSGLERSESRESTMTAIHLGSREDEANEVALPTDISERSDTGGKGKIEDPSVLDNEKEKGEAMSSSQDDTSGSSHSTSSSDETQTTSTDHPDTSDSSIDHIELPVSGHASKESSPSTQEETTMQAPTPVKAASTSQAPISAQTPTSPNNSIVIPEPLKSPSAETVGTYSDTAATSPLRPPRSLSKSPEAVRRRLSTEVSTLSEPLTDEAGSGKGSENIEQ